MLPLTVEEIKDFGVVALDGDPIHVPAWKMADMLTRIKDRDSAWDHVHKPGESVKEDLILGLAGEWAAFLALGMLGYPVEPPDDAFYPGYVRSHKSDLGPNFTCKTSPYRYRHGLYGYQYSWNLQDYPNPDRHIGGGSSSIVCCLSGVVGCRYNEDSLPQLGALLRFRFLVSGSIYREMATDPIFKKNDGRKRFVYEHDLEKKASARLTTDLVDPIFEY